jgi:hypothetical protein
MTKAAISGEWTDSGLLAQSVASAAAVWLLLKTVTQGRLLAPLKAWAGGVRCLCARWCWSLSVMREVNDA